MTSLSLSSSPAASAKVDAVVIGVTRGPKGLVLAPGSDSVASALGKGLLPALTGLGATGKAEEVTRLATLGATTAPVVVAVGLGDLPAKGTAYDAEVLRRATGAAVRALAGSRKVAVTLAAVGPDVAAQVRAVGEGALLGAYAFSRYRTTDVKHRKEPVADVVLVVPDAKDKALRAAVTRAEVVAKAVRLARDLVNTPPSDLHPVELAEVARTRCGGAGVDVEVLEGKALAKGGFGGIIGVGQGSANGPRLVHLSYKGGKGGSGTKVALVGKGITFDSGGLSLKPPTAMEEMKSDMGGAAAVIATMAAVAELALPVDVEAWVPMAENMPSGAAIRPSDILTFRNGMTVEVNNTDAEGRLILADAIARACEDGPDVVLDVATLTGAQLVALGARTTAVMGNDDALRARRRRRGRPRGRALLADAAPGRAPQGPRQRDRGPGQHRPARGRDAHRRAVPAGVRHRGRPLGAPRHRRPRLQQRGRVRLHPARRHRRGRAHLRAGPRGPRHLEGVTPGPDLPMQGEKPAP